MFTFVSLSYPLISTAVLFFSFTTRVVFFLRNHSPSNKYKLSSKLSQPAQATYFLQVGSLGNKGTAESQTLSPVLESNVAEQIFRLEGWLGTK